MAYRKYATPSPFSAENIAKSLRMLRQAEQDGTHRPGVTCNRCGNRVSGHYKFVDRGVGFANEGICIECAARAGDEDAIKVVGAENLIVPM